MLKRGVYPGGAASEQRGSPSGVARPDVAASGGVVDDEMLHLLQVYTEATDKLRASHQTLDEEVRRLRRELASADAQLQRSKRLAALGGMAAGIAHEIRNPLAAIHLYARMLVQDLSADGTLDREASADVAGKIAGAVKSLEGIVGDVLSFSREMSPRCVHTSLDALLVSVVEANEPAIEAADVDVVFVGDDAEAMLDPELMRQALLNLVRNAVQAMADGGGARSRRLTLGVELRGDTVVIAVRDTGPGIAADAVDRIFNPFFTTRSAGTGLGLAIVHRIVDAHGGSIEVRNDGGAVFELMLPIEGEPSVVNEGESSEVGDGHEERDHRVVAA